jgi:hypothetical protein
MLVLGAALAFCILHGLWFGVVGIAIFGAAVGWLGYKSMKKS